MTSKDHYTRKKLTTRNLLKRRLCVRVAPGVQICKGIIIGNIYELISIGNQIDVFVATLHGFLHDTELKSRYGKKYEESLRLATQVIENTKELISIFNSIQLAK